MSTPKWNENNSDTEWCFLTEHTRRVEWADIFENNENIQDEECLPTKLQIPKFSLPFYILNGNSNKLNGNSSILNGNSNKLNGNDILTIILFSEKFYLHSGYILQLNTAQF